jgi:uncharacterized protein YciI
VNAKFNTPWGYRRMIFVLHRLDAKGRSADRQALRDVHTEYLKKHSEKILAAGPYLDPVAGGDIGSLFLLDCRSLDEAWTFAKEDPFSAAGIFSEVRVWEWKQRMGSLQMPGRTDP